MGVIGLNSLMRREFFQCQESPNSFQQSFGTVLTFLLRLLLCGRVHVFLFINEYLSDHIYFDVNNLLYSCASKATSEEHFVRILYKSFSNILNRFPATKTVFFALDGPAPKAKLQTQLQRRLSRNMVSE